MPATYDVSLVALSVATAVFGSYVAFGLASQVSQASPQRRKFWLAGGAIALGLTIWAMHFIGMLSYQLPLPIRYDRSIVFISVMVAVSGAGAGLFSVTRQQSSNRLPWLTGSLFVGLGIVGMHFAAMASMRVAAIPVYDPTLIALSTIVAIGLAGAALWLAFPANVDLITQPQRRIGSALLMGSAIVGMYYLAMAALNFQPTYRPASPLRNTGNNTLAAIVGVTTLLLLLLGLGLSFYLQKAGSRAARSKALSQSEQRFRALVQNVSDIIAITDLDSMISYLSPSIERILAYAPQTWLDKKVLDLVHPDDQSKVETLWQQVGNSDSNLNGEFRLQHADGDWRDFEVTLKRLAQPSLAGIVITCHDITAFKQAEAQLLHNAFHDVLTGLANRSLFRERLERAFENGKRHRGDQFAVLSLDLDRFKVINDSLGHTLGDQLLIAFADRIQTCLRALDTFARLGGDEFTILLDEIEDASDAIRVAERIEHSLTLPFELDAQEVFITVSIGIALSGTAYSQSEDLLRDADMAMYRAKELGRARYQIFDPGMHAGAVARLQLETELRRAIERQELRVYYQPIVSLATLEIIGFEALVRWQHPQRGLLTPDEFIPAAEETGLILAIDQWVLQQACEQMQQWRSQLPNAASLTVSVNLANRDLAQSNLFGQISQVLQQTCLNPASLKLEITENVIMENRQAATKRLVQLKSLGVQLCIDDFGIGYSSLECLHQFPIDNLKIDRSFVSRIGRDLKTNEISLSNGPASVVGTMITLAHYLGIAVTAEGIETTAQLLQLRELKCEYCQGNLFSQPLAPQAAAGLIEAKASLLPKDGLFPKDKLL